MSVHLPELTRLVENARNELATGGMGIPSFVDERIVSLGTGSDSEEWQSVQRLAQRIRIGYLQLGERDCGRCSGRIGR